MLCRAPLLVAHRVLRSFVDAQLVVAERLAARDPRTPVVEAEFLAECGGVGQQMLLQGRLHGPESLSRELFASALQAGRRTSTWSTPAARSWPAAGRSGPPACATSSRGVAVIDELDAAARREAVGVRAVSGHAGTDAAAARPTSDGRLRDRAAPWGAFFDFDGTVIDGYSLGRVRPPPRALAAR